jgi:prepilin-type processing-associated H-X9-DG protein
MNWRCLRQLGIASSLYVQQEGGYPDANGFTGIQPYTGAPLLEPKDYNYDRSSTPPQYLGPRQSIFVCPAYNRLHGEVGGFTGDNKQVGGYGYNVNGFGSWLDENQPPVPCLGLGGYGTTYIWKPTRESWVVSPSDMIAIGDTVLAQDDSVGAVRAWADLEDALTSQSLYNLVMRGLPANDPGVQAMKQRHGGRWNIGFCDGHIESLRPTDLFNVNNPIICQRWNIEHKPNDEAAGWVPPSPP